MSYFNRLIVFLALTISTIANAEEKSRTIEGKILGIDGKGIKDAVVFLFEESSPAIGKRKPEIAPAEIVFDEKGFQDQVLVIRQFQNVVIRNKDVRGHLFFDARNTKLSPYFALIQPGDKQKVEIANLGPSKIICARHADEFLCVFISSREQFAKTDAEGSFAIKNLPNGKLKLRFWHPTAGYLLSKKLEKGVMTFEDDSPRFIEITAENQELRESKRE